MVKKLMVLMAMLAATLLAAAIPALAQQQETTAPAGATGDPTTVNFELTVVGTPPADTTFFGLGPKGSAGYVQLSDPDGDGVYTGSLPFPSDVPPNGLDGNLGPFSFIQGTGTVPGPGGPVPGQPSHLISQFGAKGGETLKESVSFPDNGGSNTPESTAPESTTPATAGTGGASDNSPSNDNSGGSGSSGSGNNAPLPPGYKRVTQTFELTVKGDPPADATFFGRIIPPAGAGSGPLNVLLTDPDGDGTYTGSDSVVIVPPEAFPPGAPVTNAVIDPPTIQIVQGTGMLGPPPGANDCSFNGCAPGEPISVIKDFGVVPLDADKTFSAKVNFKESGGGTTTPEGTTPESTTPGSTTPESTTPATGTVGSSDDNGGSASGGSENSVSAGGSSGADNSGSGGSDSGNSVSVSDNGNSVNGSGSGSSGGSVSGGSGKIGGSWSGPGGIKSLPATGGVTLATLGVAGALLVGGGLLVRRLTR